MMVKRRECRPDLERCHLIADVARGAKVLLVLEGDACSLGVEEVRKQRHNDVAILGQGVQRLKRVGILDVPLDGGNVLKALKNTSKRASSEEGKCDHISKRAGSECRGTRSHRTLTTWIAALVFSTEREATVTWRPCSDQ